MTVEVYTEYQTYTVDADGAINDPDHFSVEFTKGGGTIARFNWNDIIGYKFLTDTE